MGYVKKRVRKTKASDPDEFVSIYQRTLDWARDNLNVVLYSGVAFLLVILAVFGLMWSRANRDRAAGEALDTAVATYQSRGYGEGTSDSQAVKDGLKQSLKSFRAVSSQYPRTRQGNSATLYAANILFRMTSFSEAAAVLEDLISHEPEFSRRLQVSYLLGRAYEGGKEYDKAISVYGRLLENSGVEMRPVLMMDRARCFDLKGDRKQAADTYRSVVKDFADSVFSLRAKSQLAILGESAEESP